MARLPRRIRMTESTRRADYIAAQMKTPLGFGGVMNRLTDPAQSAELVRLHQAVEQQRQACTLTGPQGEVDWKTGYKAALGWVLFRIEGLLNDGCKDNAK